MTYDGLFKKITDLTPTRDVDTFAIALLRVLELHKPIYDNSCSDADCCGGPYPDLCDGCKDDYPCATIQAIEKELK